MSEGRQLKTLHDVDQFIHAGNAMLTIVSKVTGTRYTYRITRSKDDAVFFVSVLNGPDNGHDFMYLGLISNRDSHVFTGTRKSPSDAPSFKAFAWFHHWIAQRAILPEQVEIWHEGRCGKCGRTLTVPESIDRGIGPECWAQMQDGLDRVA